VSRSDDGGRWKTGSGAFTTSGSYKQVNFSWLAGHGKRGGRGISQDWPCRRIMIDRDSYLDTVANAFQKGGERWALFRDGVPTLGHDAVDWGWTIRRWLQATAVGDKLHYVLISSSRIRHVAQGENFPEEHAV